ncbi:MAG TPA: GAF domain-containing protein, partial [Aggregatilineales bacterium]|nr:GAF domain-containing protein [Aggregatilineales bacterium]
GDKNSLPAFQSADAILSDPLTIGAARLLLANRGKPIGVVEFLWNEPCEFNERDHELYCTLAHQMTAALDSVQLFQDITTRIERTEQLLRVTNALSQATDEPGILDSLTELPLFNECYRYSLYYIDVNQNNLLVHPSAYRKDGQTRYFDPGTVPHPLLRYTLETIWFRDPGHIVMVEDLASDSRYNLDNRVDTPDLVALVMIPLFGNGMYQGVLTIGWQMPRTFTPENVILFEALRNVLPPYITTRRAFLREGQAHHKITLHARYLEAIADLGAIITGILDEHKLLEAIARLLVNSFPEFEVYLYLLNGESLELIEPQRAVVRGEAARAHTIPLHASGSLMVEALEQGESRVVGDIDTTPAYDLTPLM